MQQVDPRLMYYTGTDASGRAIAIPTGAYWGSWATSYGGSANTARTAEVDQTDLNQQANALLELSALHNSLLVSGQLIATGTGDNTSAQLPVSMVKKPWLDAPDGAVPFDPQTIATMPVIGAGVTAVSLTVPDGYDGVITAYSWNVVGGGFVQGSGDLQAQVQRDGVAIRNYENILVEKGSIAIPRPIAPLRVYSGQTISLVVNHVANNMLSNVIVGSFVGYFYPSMS